MRIATWIALGMVCTLAACSSPVTEAPAATPAASPAASTAAPTAAPTAETLPASAVAPASAAQAAAPASEPRPAAAPSQSASRPAATAPTSSAPAVAPARVEPAPAAALAQATAARPAPPAPVYREITVPSGTTLAVELRTAVASDTSAVEDRVQGVLRRAITVDGVEVVPAGATVTGVVTEAQRSGRVKGRARVALRFTSLTIDDAPTTIGTAPIAREAAATKKEDAAKIGIGAGAGAVVGAITGGKKGAAVGGAVGAGAGTGVVLATRGDEVTLAAGTSVTTTLSRPLVVRVREP